MSKIKYSAPSPKTLYAQEPLLAYFPKSDISAYISATRKGLSKSFLNYLSDKLFFTLSELAVIFHVSERTLQRYTDKDRLPTDISEKSLLLDALYKKGENVFGSLQDFNLWMRTPSVVFNNNSPLSYLDTSFGFQLVFTELGRIEHGVFA